MKLTKEEKRKILKVLEKKIKNASISELEDALNYIIDEELEIVKSRPTKGLPLLKLESISTLTKLKQKLFKEER